jgi:hypothetical protein
LNGSLLGSHLRNHSGAQEFDAFSGERGLWKCFTIDAFDSPNLQGLSLEQLLQLDPAEGGPLDQNRFIGDLPRNLPAEVLELHLGMPDAG